jgi:long-chain acyl-CoA synthetase
VAAYRRSRLLDEDGFVFLVDRKKDLIKTSGFQVWPREIEGSAQRATRRCSKWVSPACPTAVKGEVSHAWVGAAKRPVGHGRVTCASTAARNSRLTKFPRAVHFRTELPKTTVGKVLRRALATSQ